MKCQCLFSGKNKKNIIGLLSAEFAQRVVKVNKLLQVSFSDTSGNLETLAKEMTKTEDTNINMHFNHKYPQNLEY